MCLIKRLAKKCRRNLSSWLRGMKLTKSVKLKPGKPLVGLFKAEMVASNAEKMDIFHESAQKEGVVAVEAAVEALEAAAVAALIVANLATFLETALNQDEVVKRLHLCLSIFVKNKKLRI